MNQTATSEHERTLIKLASKRPLLRAAEVMALGIPSVVLTRLVAKHKLERLSRGLYSLPGRSISEHRSLAEAASRVPRSVVCLLSALRVHGIGTQAPFEVWLALPNHRKAPRVDQPALRIVYMSGPSLLEGVQSFDVDGVVVQIFDAEKTVVDCFKYRNKIGLDVALEALRDGWRQRKLNMDKLWHYAVVDRVSNVIRPYLESLDV